MCQERLALAVGRREKAADYNQAVRLLTSGQAAAGMERLDGMGWIKEEAGDYLSVAAAEYLHLLAAAKPKESVLCMAPTWPENHVLTFAMCYASGKVTGGCVPRYQGYLPAWEQWTAWLPLRRCRSLGVATTPALPPR